LDPSNPTPTANLKESLAIALFHVHCPISAGGRHQLMATSLPDLVRPTGGHVLVQMVNGHDGHTRDPAKPFHLAQLLAAATDAIEVQVAAGSGQRVDHYQNWVDRFYEVR
jgi:hypothetical protein